MEADRGGAALRTYRLEPLDASGVFLGLGAVQCCLLGTGLTVAVLAVTAGVWLPVAAMPVIGGVTLAFARAGGQPAWQRLPVGTGWAWTILRRGRRWAAPLPLLPCDGSEPPPLPPCLAGLDVLVVTWRGGLSLGAIRDRERATLTAVVPVQVTGFATETRREQEGLLSGWGDVLAQFAVDRGLVTHLFWSDLSRPSALLGHRVWLDDDGHVAGDSTPEDSYRGLLDTAAGTATAHDLVVGITVARDRLPPRRVGNPGELLGQGLVAAVEALLRALGSASVVASDPLDAIGLHRLLRTRIDPAGQVAVGSSRGPGPGRLIDRLGLVTPASSGPLIVEASWRHVRIDDAWHRTWWVACWPRMAVPPWWLEPFVSTSSGGEAARTMTVTFVPVPARQSRRRIERDLVKLSSDAATKEEKGRRVDAGHQRATESLLEREAELVAGYAEMAYVGLVGVSAGSEHDLEEQSEIVEQLAREVGMELRLLDGRQDIAWAAGLPLGLAPKTMAGT